MGWATPLLASATAAAAAAALPFDPAYDEGLGHSFCYVRLDKFVVPFSADDLVADAKAAAAAEEATTVSSGFESSESFAVVPLQPVPRLPSGPISKPFSGGFLSGPLDAALLSRPLPGAATSGRMGGAIPALRRSLSHGGRRLSGSWLTGRCSSRRSLWQQFRRSSVGAGEADEDRVHIVVSEELGWVFVGIYDGFNGPDATDFLVSHLYAAVHRELRGLLWEQREQEQQQDQRPDQPSSTPSTTTSDHQDQWSRCRRTCRSRPLRGSDRDQRRWKCEWECDYSSLKPPTQQPPRSNSENDHIAVLRWGKRKEGLGKSRAQQSGSGEDGRCRLRVLGFVWSVLRVMRFVCATYSVSNAVPIERSWGQTQRSSLRARRSVPLNVGARGGMAVGLHAQTER